MRRVVLSVVLAVAVICPTCTAITLGQAIKLRKIKAEFRVIAQGAGDIVEARLTNSGASAVDIQVNRGSILETESERNQLFVGKQVDNSVGAKETKLVTLRAYQTNPEAPITAGTQLKPGVTELGDYLFKSDSKKRLQRLSKMLPKLSQESGGEFGPSEIRSCQLVIWAVMSGNRTDIGELATRHGWGECAETAGRWYRFVTQAGSPVQHQASAASTAKKDHRWASKTEHRSNSAQATSSGNRHRTRAKTEGNGTKGTRTADGTRDRSHVGGIRGGLNR